MVSSAGQLLCSVRHHPDQVKEFAALLSGDWGSVRQLPEQVKGFAARQWG
jgi:hypothetical protein